MELKLHVSLCEQYYDHMMFILLICIDGPNGVTTMLKEHLTLLGDVIEVFHDTIYDETTLWFCF